MAVGANTGGEQMKFRSELRVLIGAAAGGAFGYVLFFALVRHGKYGLAIPGGLLGLGAGIFKTKSKIVPVICGLAALALGLLAQWRLTATHVSFIDFLRSVPEYPRFTLLMIAVGAAIGFYVPFRRGQELKADSEGS